MLVRIGSRCGPPSHSGPRRLPRTTGSAALRRSPCERCQDDRNRRPPASSFIEREQPRRSRADRENRLRIRARRQRSRARLSHDVAVTRGSGRSVGRHRFPGKTAAFETITSAFFYRRRAAVCARSSAHGAIGSKRSCVRSAFAAIRRRWRPKTRRSS